MPVFIVFATAVEYTQPARFTAEVISGPHATRSDAQRLSATPDFIALRDRRFADTERLEILRGLFEWNYRVDPVRLVENGEEPRLHRELAARVLER